MELEVQGQALHSHIMLQWVIGVSLCGERYSITYITKVQFMDIMTQPFQADIGRWDDTILTIIQMTVFSLSCPT